MIIHRKGSAPCKLGKLIVIPGSRGALTYVVNPLKSDISHGYSVSHGAGRKVSRNKAIDIMNDCTEVDKQKKLNLSEFGENIVICESKELFCEEAPFAYKDINVVINDLVELGLVEVVMSLRPIITYKMRCQC
jgi:release factor H-coupled RctB family protein